ILLSAVAHAAEEREFFNGVRSLGMGGVSVAVANDETALLANPAALGKIRDFYGTVLDPEIDGGMNLNAMYTKKAFGELYNPKVVYKTLEKSPGKYYHNQGTLFPSLVVRNFGMGFYGRYLLDSELNAAGDDLRIDYIQDYAAVLGLNIRFWDGRIKIGASGKVINRAEIAKNVNPTTDDLTVKANAAEGVGIGTDVGLILTAPWHWLPTLSVVARDMGGTKFTQKGLLMNTAERPADIEADYDVGFAIFPIHGKNFRSTWAIEYKSVLKAAEEEDKAKHYHLGYELNVGDIIFFRAGMNQRYYTVGAEFASEHIQMQFAYYGEEIGTADALEEDRRLVGKIAYRF
ncbi:MAG: hypothetical protein AB7O96_14685, partial [Pseudobdellovibrionaceae bacterium]